MTSFFIQTDSIHGSLALKIANEVISDPISPGIRVLCKTLTQLQLLNAKKSDLKDLMILHEAMTKVSTAGFWYKCGPRSKVDTV